MLFPILKYNRLKEIYPNLWTMDTQKDMYYSDGETAEKYLENAVLKAQDLSSSSLELEEVIYDWVSEYHLSSQRANLLRALNLGDISTALELGSGCGAITRYLGELGIKVDSIEGNLRRAEIARLRCRDLENVNVVNANFNELVFPKGEYDAILLVGVLEYAKRYFSTPVSDKHATVSILRKAKSALKDGGVLLIAIENRMGLKYWMGAPEDHYGKPYIGLCGYPTDQGIRTYDKREWIQILDMSYSKNYRFLYPFPDYKIANTILSDDFIKKNEYAHSVLYGMSSRDYFGAWRPNSCEFLFWESIHKSGYFEHFANSFFILVSETKDRLDQLAPYDFVHFSDISRKPKFRTMTIKPRDKDFIVKRQLMDTGVDENTGLVNQNQLGARDTYITGQLLSTIWIHSLFETDNPSVFEKLIKAYYALIFDRFTKHGESFEFFDLLPSNIIVDGKEAYNIIDREWAIDIKVSPEYVLFRGLLWFCNRNGMLINRLYEPRKFLTIKEFVEYGFNLCSLELKEKIDQFIEIEERLQREICFQKEPNSIERMLMEPIQYYDMVLQTNSFIARLYWIENEGEFLEERSVTVSAHLGLDRQILIFRLPHSVNNAKSLRLDPSDRSGFFHLFKIRLIRYKQDENKKKLLWQLHSSQEIALHSKMEGIYFCKAALGDVFLSICDDPQITFELPEGTISESKEGTLQFEIEMDWPRSADYIIAEDALGKEIEKRDQQIQSKGNEIRAKDDEIRANTDRFDDELRSLRMQLEAASLLHERLLNSKSWRLGAPLRSIFRYIKKIGLNLKMVRYVFDLEYKLIKRSGLFDAEYYLEKAPDVKHVYKHSLVHYVIYGFSEGRDPHPLFDTSYYLDENPDVAESGVNPLVHYINVGASEGRDPHPLFDTVRYLNQNPDLAELGMNPLIHYIKTVIKEEKNRDPSQI